MLVSSRSKTHVIVISMSSAAVCPASHNTCLTQGRRRAIQALHGIVFEKRTVPARQGFANGIKWRRVADKKTIGSTRPARNRLNNWHNKIPEKRVRHNPGSRHLGDRLLQTNRQTVWETSDEGHGAVHNVKGSRQGAGAARVARGAHHLALVHRGQVRAILRRQITCRQVTALLFLAHGVRRHRVSF